MTRAQDDAGIVAALRDIADAHVDGAWLRGEGGLQEAETALFDAIDAWAGKRDVAVCRAVTAAYHLAHTAQEVSLGNIVGAADLAIEAQRLIAEERAAHPLVMAIAPNEMTDERRAEVLESLRELGARGGAIVPADVPCTDCAENRAELERERKARQIAEDAAMALGTLVATEGNRVGPIGRFPR